jgi:hypothetical protein
MHIDNAAEFIAPGAATASVAASASRAGQSIVTIRVDDVNESMPNLASATTLDGMSEVARRHDTVAKGAAVQLSA